MALYSISTIMFGISSDLQYGMLFYMPFSKQCMYNDIHVVLQGGKHTHVSFAHFKRKKHICLHAIVVRQHGARHMLPAPNKLGQVNTLSQNTREDVFMCICVFLHKRAVTSHQKGGTNVCDRCQLRKTYAQANNPLHVTPIHVYFDGPKETLQRVIP